MEKSSEKDVRTWYQDAQHIQVLYSYQLIVL